MMMASALRRSSMRVLAIGNTIMDTVLSAEHIPVDDKVWIDFKQTFVGGQGANAAQSMQKLGLAVTFLTRLGSDDSGSVAKAHYESLGIDTSHCISVKNSQTMSAFVLTSTKQQTRTCLMHKDPKLFELNTAEHLAKIDLDRFDAVYTDGHQIDLTMPIVEQAAKRGLPTIADVEVVDSDGRALAKQVSHLIAPVQSIRELAEEEDISKALQILASSSTYAGHTFIGTGGTDGSWGAQRGNESIYHVPAHKCQVKDTVGAGDAFHAGFLAALARGEPSLQAQMSFATRVAAALVETAGPVASREALERWQVL